MKLTRLQRYTAYCIMLEWFEEVDDDCYRFYCEALRDVFGLPWDSSLLEKHFPELYRYKPEKAIPQCAWFGNNNTVRKRILRHVIIETHP